MSKALLGMLAGLALPAVPAVPAMFGEGGSEEPKGVRERRDRTRDVRERRHERANEQRPPRRGLPPSLLGGECDAIAFAVKKANEHAAEEAYWIKLANCANDPSCDLGLYEPTAFAEMEEEILEAEEQYEARLLICAALGGGQYAPDVDPSEFSTIIDNVYMPLIPGRSLTYESVSAEGTETTVVRASHDVVVIDGFESLAVSDKVSLDGVLIEDTVDWFAQRSDGSVWYFGEIAKNYEDGVLVDLDGSWRTGTEGAQPGLVMPANPAVGDFYRQEFLIGEAEDVALVVALDETVEVPYGTFEHCLKTEDRSPFNPDSIEWKYFAPGVGLVLEVHVGSGERNELVKIKN